MDITDFAAAAEAAGWVSAAEDRDSFGDYRSASWRSPTGAQIVHVTTDRSPLRRNVIDRVVASTTDALGWALSPVGAWTVDGGGLDGALSHLRDNGTGS